MQLFRCLYGSLVTGLLGALAWGLIRHFGHVEIGFFAIFVGAFIGAGSAGRFRARAGMPAAIIAALVAIVAVFGGKYFDVIWSVESRYPSQKIQALQVNDSMALHHMARTIAGEYERDGKPLNWPDGMTAAKARKPTDFPPDVIADTYARYHHMTPVERMNYRNDVEHETIAAETNRVDRVTNRAFIDIALSPFNILWLFLASTTAFRVGAGRLRAGRAPTPITADAPPDPQADLQESQDPTKGS
jgi:hypothetical protein